MHCPHQSVSHISGVIIYEHSRSVPELGCGYGRITNRLAGKVARVAGLDISPTLLKRPKRLGWDGSRYVLGDMRSLPCGSI
ncbi:MAG: class I SAM-dependent methyltransferase [Mesorhizobium sp.]|nr:MAG: class I SAM-dependent methyltransferase [Mesorhizobium sp.]